MSFPDASFGHVADYADSYFTELAQAAATVDRAALAAALTLLEHAYEHRRWVYVCGSRGAAAIAGHLVRDHMVGARRDTDLLPRVMSLNANLGPAGELDGELDPADMFMHQLSSVAHTDDVLLAISGTSDTEALVRACDWAVHNGLKAIAVTGFNGGRLGDLADVHLHVAARNHGIVEDVQQSLMHILAQYLRQARMPEDLIAARAF